jgi:hypothetical protein
VPAAAVETASSLDWTAIGTNLGVFSLALSATIGGIYQGIKKLKKGDLDLSTVDIKKAPAAPMILLETTSMLMWSESNRNVAEAVKDLNDDVVELRHGVQRLTEELRVAAALASRQERGR